jgi:hypothetical protein
VIEDHMPRAQRRTASAVDANAVGRDLLFSVGPLRRQWRILVLMVLATVATAFGVSRVLPPTYRVVGTVVVVPPGAGPSSVDPYSHISSAYHEVAKVLVDAVTSDDVVARHKAQGDASYLATTDAEAPTITVTATGHDATKTEATMLSVIREISVFLNNKQLAAGTNSTTWLSVAPVSVPSRPAQTEATLEWTLLAAGLGVVTSIGATVIVDRISVARRRRLEAGRRASSLCWRPAPARGRAPRPPQAPRELDFFALMMGLGRQWLIFALMLAAAAAAVIGVHRTMPQSYQAVGTVVLVPPPAAAGGGNPYDNFNSDLHLLAVVIVESVTSDDAVAQTKAKGGVDYTVTTDPEAPTITVTASGQDRNRTEDTMQTVIQGVSTFLKARQSETGTKPSTWVSIADVSVPSSAEPSSAKLKVELIVAVLGLLASISVVLMVDFVVMARRARRVAAAETLAVSQASRVLENVRLLLNRDAPAPTSTPAGNEHVEAAAEGLGPLPNRDSTGLTTDSLR